MKRVCWILNWFIDRLGSQISFRRGWSGASIPEGSIPVQLPSEFWLTEAGLRLFFAKLYCRLPLPKEVPMDFRVLPEYIVEDIVDYLFFAVQCVLLVWFLKIVSSFCLQNISPQLRIDRQSRANDFCVDVLAVYVVHQESVLEIEDQRCTIAFIQLHGVDINWCFI